jgi:hypothetical protein
MAARAQSKSGFPVVVNDLVLAQLNMYIGTPEGREFMRLSLQRMENYRGVVSENLQKYEMPAELMALPIIETGYRKPDRGAKQHSGAGCWSVAVRPANRPQLRPDRR